MPLWPSCEPSVRNRSFAERRPNRAFAFGDSHYMRIDMPLTKTYPGCVAAQDPCTPVATPSESPGDRIYNFTRVEVPGDGDVHWIVAHVRSNRQNPFSFEFRLVQGNQ